MIHITSLINYQFPRERGTNKASIGSPPPPYTYSSYSPASLSTVAVACFFVSELTHNKLACGKLVVNLQVGMF